MSRDTDPGDLLRRQIDARLSEATIEPDIGDVFERVRELGEISFDGLDDEDWLAPFVEAYCQQIAEVVENRAIDPEDAPDAGSSRRGWWWAVAAVAAVALLAFSVRWIVEGRGLAEIDRNGAGLNDAQHDARPSQAKGEMAVPRGERGRGKSPKPERVEPRPLPSEPPVEHVVPVEPEAVEEPPLPDPSQKSRPTTAQRLEALDEQAQAAWRRGDLRTAERRYRAIVALTAKRERHAKAAELAYGELFAIVRQRGGDLPTLWRAYLRRFPRGRYAEDVHAGLCRRGAASERDECWAQYRQRYPNGIHEP